MAFMGVLHQPTRQRLPLKRVSRLVVLPDYQGIGIGRAFLDAIAAMYVNEGLMFEIKTSARNLIGSLRNHPDWSLSNYAFSKRGGQNAKAEKRKSLRTDCKTASFKYMGTGCPPFVSTGGEVAWKFHDYRTDLTAKKRILTFGKGQQSSIRSDCKVATFRAERAHT